MKRNFTLQEQRNTVKSKIHHNKRHVLNKMVNVNNSFRHEAAKLLRGLELVYEGCEVLVEAEFTNGTGIADLLITDVDWCEEILESETMERFKQKKYPVTKIIPNKASEVIKRCIKEEL